MWFFNTIWNFFSSIWRWISNFFWSISRWIWNFYSKIISWVNESEKIEEKTIDELRPSVFTRTVWQDDDWWSQWITWTSTIEDDWEFMYSENNKKNEIKTVKYEYDIDEEKQQPQITLDTSNIDTEIDITLKEFSEKFKIVDQPWINYELEITNDSINVLKNWVQFLKKEWKFTFTDQQIKDILLSIKRDNIELDSNSWIEELLNRLEHFES